jgi:uncharacterized protein YndB with AHSA1/START domain
MNDALVFSLSIFIDSRVSVVWKALVTPEIIKGYFFGTEVHTDWQKGSRIIFRGTLQDGTYQDKGVILENEPERFLSYTYWSSFSGLPDRPENYQTISYTLAEVADGTMLTVIQKPMRDERAKFQTKQHWEVVLDGLRSYCQSVR